MEASPAPLVIALLAESDAVPLVNLKLMVTFGFGTPRSSTSTVSGMAMVAPCPTQRAGVRTTKSRAEDVPTTVACCDCGGEYTAGARAVVIVLVPIAVGVTQLEASPAASLSAEHEEDPLHMENCKPLAALHAIVAPFTGVTPSAATARTRIALAACDPMGVDGSEPCKRSRRSVARAPYVSAPNICEKAPVAESVTWMVASPSCGAAGTMTWICVAEAESTLPMLPPKFTCSPGLKPMPWSVVTPPATLRRAGVTV